MPRERSDANEPRASKAMRATRTERAGESGAARERVGESEGRSPSDNKEANGARWPSRSSKPVVSRVERDGWVQLPGASAIRLDCGPLREPQARSWLATGRMAS